MKPGFDAKHLIESNIVVHACNPSTQEAQAGGIRNSKSSLVTSDFKTSLSYVRSCLSRKSHLDNLV